MYRAEGTGAPYFLRPLSPLRCNFRLTPSKSSWQAGGTGSTTDRSGLRLRCRGADDDSEALRRSGQEQPSGSGDLGQLAARWGTARDLGAGIVHTRRCVI
jgi:hypothetical protein